MASTAVERIIQEKDQVEGNMEEEYTGLRLHALDFGECERCRRAQESRTGRLTEHRLFRIERSLPRCFTRRPHLA